MEASMASKEECDRFAAEVARRFEDFTKWTISNWPQPAHPLDQSDFNASRREIAGLLGDKLSSEQTDSPSAGGPQYVNMNPAPWP
jgi:hypothetical protein